jgi:hypothetical protein
VSPTNVLLAICLAAALLASPSRAAVEIKESGDTVRIEVGGELFTEYRHAGAPHVYYYPVIGPGGAKMTRSWPIQEVEGEERDHPHHRSLWFSHGLVNGVDFWSELSPNPDQQTKHAVGKIVHDAVLEAKGGPNEGILKTRQKWVAPDGSVPLTSVQTLRVYNRPATERLFDFEITLTAGEKDVLLGDTKEGTMAIRINESMRLIQPKKQPGKGQMVNSAGDRDGKVWGKKATWVDYSGPVEGKIVGIAIFDHPSNLRHPTRWHARDYGLFAANPFCEHEMDKSQPKGAADHTISAGQSLTLRYRFYLHERDAEQAQVASRFAEYAAGK